MCFTEPAISSTLVFFVNGVKVVDSEVNPEWTLLQYLRQKLHLTGTKLGCAEGGCGACTVMVSKFDRVKKKITHSAVNACLTPVCAVHGLAVTTVEGIGSTRTRLHPVQERIAKAHGSQCGFCTPGIVMSMYSLLRSHKEPTLTMDDMEVAFQGNLCRCTGYRPIIEGFRSFIEEWEQVRARSATNGTTNGCGMGENCCKVKKNGLQNGTADSADEEDGKLFNQANFAPYDPTQEPIFPSELQLSDKLDSEFFMVKGQDVTWYRPSKMEDLLALKAKYNHAKIVVGNTEVGVEVKFKKCSYPVIIHPVQIKELSSFEIKESGVQVGASITLSDLENNLKAVISQQPSYKTKIFKAIVKMLHWFAGKQIRNVAAIGGNIMTGSPISDLNPILMAANCQLVVESKTRGVRHVTMDEKFFTGYRRNVIAPDEILKSIIIPYTTQRHHFRAYKQARRRDDDISIVNAAFSLELDENNCIDGLRIVYGGVAPVTTIAKKTSQQLIGKKWDRDMLNEAYSLLMDDLPLDPGAPGGMIQYRRSLTLSLFFKFYLTVCNELSIPIPSKEASGVKTFHTLTPKSSQYFEKRPNETRNDLVGRPIVHMSAFKQAAGEAIYCDDIPRNEQELYLAYVISSRAHAKLLNVDPSPALALKGVHAFFSEKDLPGDRNKVGAIFFDEDVFARDKVLCQGQTIGVVVADTQVLAQRAARLVKVEYEDLEPIITIEDAIAAKSFFKDPPQGLVYGDPESAFATADHVLTGEVRSGGQEHFYLETHCALVVPKREDDELDVLTSSQHPTEIQHLIAHVLGVPDNRIVCRVKRMGGGFGGKESRPSLVSIPCAVAAHRLQRPVRCMMDRDEDIVMTGQRHPFLSRYKIGFTKEGKIVAVDITLYCNAGMSFDLSTAVMNRAMMHYENCYKVPNVSIKGYLCRTNIPSNTAFRGFGGPQGMFVGENMIRHMAEFLKKDFNEIALLNFYKENDLTHFKQVLKRNTLQRCWDEVVETSDYKNRRIAVEEFNKQNRWHKRGITLTPTAFGIAFETLFLNQSGAFVLVYADGSVLISHGGTEMGQGLHTKMIQVASRCLDIPVSLIHISETSTDKVPNTSATAASCGSDLNGMAIIDACNQIMERLKPYKKAKPDADWKTWVHDAFFDRVSLAASGFYKTPDIGHGTENYFNYFVYGVACAEVEIDCLTGDHQVLRTDIVMDLGESLNPAIDIGQVEGGFMQGYGLFVMEELMTSPSGFLYTRGPGAYKIPGFADIPAEFNVSLLKGAPNPRAVYSSKAVGEPPLFLASSVFFAIKEAIKAARKDAGNEEYFKLDAPATSARIRMACLDEITAKVSLSLFLHF
nr:PREDICTED: xanthine dehydrogenase [Bemisia tabaci]